MLLNENVLNEKNLEQINLPNFLIDLNDPNTLTSTDILYNLINPLFIEYKNTGNDYLYLFSISLFECLSNNSNNNLLLNDLTNKILQNNLSSNYKQISLNNELNCYLIKNFKS